MISGRLMGVPEHRIIEQVGERGEGAIKSSLAGWPPIRVLKNQTDILDGKLADARILEKEAFVVENESGGERIGKGQKRQQGERSGREHAPPSHQVEMGGAQPLAPCRVSSWLSFAFQVNKTTISCQSSVVSKSPPPAVFITEY